MDVTDFTAQEYASFLVRLWRCGVPAADGSSGEWRGEVEHIQSGQRWAFGSVIELDELGRACTETVRNVLARLQSV